MEQYFITLQSFTLEEYEVWRQLNKHCNYDTNIAGYTINQLVVNSDKRLNLTTKKVRNILKKFENKGYIQPLTSGSKGKESTLKITIKGQLWGNNGATLSKNKDKNNNIYSVVIDYLNIKANTSYRINTKNTQSLINARTKEGFTVEDFKKVIDSKSKEWLGTDF